jgi:copper homeostasis protein
MTVEICVEDLPQALAAEAAGAHRLELCSDLSNGGLTPSFGLTQTLANRCSIPVYAMVRPRGGHFCYTADERAIMHREIEYLAQAGATGVVFGVLTADKQLDEKATADLVNRAKQYNLKVTFHRAIDECNSPLATIDALSAMGIENILTSGGAAKAADGLRRLEQMVQQADGKINIMAGSGVNGTNVREIIKCGVDAVHMTARRVIPADTRLDMGECYAPDTYKLEELFDALAK